MELVELIKEFDFILHNREALRNVSQQMMWLDLNVVEKNDTCTGVEQ